jgi:hypothetical protein
MIQTDGYQPKFACVTMGQQSSQAISQANQLHSGLAPIREVQLGPFGAGGILEVSFVTAVNHNKPNKEFFMKGKDLYIAEMRCLLDHWNAHVCRVETGAQYAVQKAQCDNDAPDDVQGIVAVELSSGAGNTPPCLWI